MTPQEVFDKVVTHLRNQKVKSMDSHGACQYRGPGGLKCAVGCLIDDKDYRPWMEGGSVLDLVFMDNEKVLDEEHLPDGVKDLFGEHEELLSHLQMIHDQEEIQDWESEFKDTAKEHRLKYTLPIP